MSEIGTDIEAYPWEVKVMIYDASKSYYYITFLLVSVLPLKIIFSI